MIKKEDGRIDFHKPAAQIHNLVRGTNPWPVAWCLLEETPIKIWETRKTGPNSHKETMPWRLCDRRSQGRLVRRTGGGCRSPPCSSPAVNGWTPRPPCWAARWPGSSWYDQSAKDRSRSLAGYYGCRRVRQFAVEGCVGRLAQREAHWVSAVVYTTLDHLLYIDHVLAAFAKGRVQPVMPGGPAHGGSPAVVYGCAG